MEPWGADGCNWQLAVGMARIAAAMGDGEIRPEQLMRESYVERLRAAQGVRESPVKRIRSVRAAREAEAARKRSKQEKQS